MFIWIEMHLCSTYIEMRSLFDTSAVWILPIESVTPLIAIIKKCFWHFINKRILMKKLISNGHRLNVQWSIYWIKFGTVLKCHCQNAIRLTVAVFCFAFSFANSQPDSTQKHLVANMCSMHVRCDLFGFGQSCDFRWSRTDTTWERNVSNINIELRSPNNF